MRPETFKEIKSLVSQKEVKYMDRAPMKSPSLQNLIQSDAIVRRKLALKCGPVVAKNIKKIRERIYSRMVWN